MNLRLIANSQFRNFSNALKITINKYIYCFRRRIADSHDRIKSSNFWATKCVWCIVYLRNSRNLQTNNPYTIPGFILTCMRSHIKEKCWPPELKHSLSCISQLFIPVNKIMTKKFPDKKISSLSIPPNEAFYSFVCLSSRGRVTNAAPFSRRNDSKKFK